MDVKRKRDSAGYETLKGVRKTKIEVDDPKVLSRGTVADLPYDLIKAVLLKLPLKSVLICKCVCKSWRSILSEIEFSPTTAFVRTNGSRRVSRTLHLLNLNCCCKGNESMNSLSDGNCSHVCSCEDSLGANGHNHMKLEVKFKLPLCNSNKIELDKMADNMDRGKKRAYIASKPEYDKFDVVNSCNGLLYLWQHVKGDPLTYVKQKKLVVCNPITGDFIIPPWSVNHELMKRESFCSALGYVRTTNEYKVIVMYKCFMNGAIVEIHTLGTTSWRNIKYRGPRYMGFNNPTCLNGSLHWLAYGTFQLTILCFDLEKETQVPFPLPPAISSTALRQWCGMGIGEIKGSLYICCPYPYADNVKCLKFWAMKTYGDVKSWTEILSFNVLDFCNGQHLYNPRVAFGGPGILIHYPPKRFIYYDPQKSLFKFLEGHGTSSEMELFFHTPSLVRLKDVLKDNDVEVLNVHSRCAELKLREEKEVLHMTKYRPDLRM